MDIDFKGDYDKAAHDDDDDDDERFVIALQ